MLMDYMYSFKRKFKKIYDGSTPPILIPLKFQPRHSYVPEEYLCILPKESPEVSYSHGEQ